MWNTHNKFLNNIPFINSEMETFNNNPNSKYVHQVFNLLNP